MRCTLRRHRPSSAYPSDHGCRRRLLGGGPARHVDSSRPATLDDPQIAHGRVRASPTPESTCASMPIVGTEHLDPGDSGEIGVAEIEADAISRRTRVRCGIRADHDDRLRDDMITVVVDEDSRDVLTSTVIWRWRDERDRMPGARRPHLRSGADVPDPAHDRRLRDVTGARNMPQAATVRRVQAW